MKMRLHAIKHKPANEILDLVLHTTSQTSAGQHAPAKYFRMGESRRRKKQDKVIFAHILNISYFQMV